MIIIKTSQGKRPDSGSDSGSAGVSKNLSPISKPNEVSALSSARFTDDAMDGGPERFRNWLKVTQPGSWLQSHTLNHWGRLSEGEGQTEIEGPGGGDGGASWALAGTHRVSPRQWPSPSRGP